MSRMRRIGGWVVALGLACAGDAVAQRRPYIGYVYPAGGRQGTTFEVRLGGQDVMDVQSVLVSGEGVTARLVNYERRLSPQDITLLNEQLKELKATLPKPPPPAKPPTPPVAKPVAKPAAKPPAKPEAKVKPSPPATATGRPQGKPDSGTKPAPGASPAGEGKPGTSAPPVVKPAAPAGKATPPATSSASGGSSQAPVPGAAKPVVPAPAVAKSAAPAQKPPVPEMKAAAPAGKAPVATPPKPPAPEKPADPATLRLIEKIERRLANYVGQPAVQSVANLVYLEVSIAANAAPGEREIRLLTPQGVSNPLVFVVGEVPENVRKPMNTSPFQVLGKEELSKRKRPPEEAEVTVNLPCVANGQVASGEVNFYRFQARKGQPLVFSVAARSLIPYIADAVPGWFQPVLRLCDAKGREVAYVDDFRFSPDPVLFYQVPADGEYVVSICDGIFRGREDFVYRLSIGELPVVTQVFPLAGQAGVETKVTAKGWNLAPAPAFVVPADAAPGIRWLQAKHRGLVSNRVPFLVDDLPARPEREPNHGPSAAQTVNLPLGVDARIDQPGDIDVYEFTGRAGETVVAEVLARRLGAPTDTALAITAADGSLLDFNDDSEDLGSGLNTHHADSMVSAKLPTDGKYRVTVCETAGCGGEEYGYRLRIGPPRPDFELRVVPSSLAIKGKSANRVTVHAIRKDGFLEPIKISLSNPPAGFSAQPVVLAPHQDSVSFTIKSDLADTGLRAVDLTIEGRASVNGIERVHPAVPAEDRMQAFLWRHLVPAGDFKVLVFDGNFKPQPKRPLPQVTGGK